jgi:hypothetical protein
MSTVETDVNQKLDSAFNIMLQGAHDIKSLAQALCPVLTGYLRSTIDVLVIENSEGVKSVSVQVTAPYAGIVESKRHFLSNAVSYVEPQITEQLKQLFGENQDVTE